MALNCCFPAEALSLRMGIVCLEPLFNQIMVSLGLPVAVQEVSDGKDADDHDHESDDLVGVAAVVGALHHEGGEVAGLEGDVSVVVLGSELLVLAVGEDREHLDTGLAGLGVVGEGHGGLSREDGVVAEADVVDGALAIQERTSSERPETSASETVSETVTA